MTKMTNFPNNFNFVLNPELGYNDSTIFNAIPSDNGWKVNWKNPDGNYSVVEYPIEHIEEFVKTGDWIIQENEQATF